MVPGITQLLDELNAELDELEKKVEPTWHGLVEPVERLTDRLSLAWGTVSHLKVTTLPDHPPAVLVPSQRGSSTVIESTSQRPMPHALTAVSWHE